MRFPTPKLRAIILSIAVLLIGLAGVAFWYMWHVQPQTSGTLAVPVSANASVVRDSLGVPHISAATWEDAIVLQGFITAQDRMIQMDLQRRYAAGQLAEVLGAELLEADRESRRLQLDRAAEAGEALLSPEEKKIYSLYARGVNYYLETARGKLPLEFALARYEPRPWTIKDSLLCGLAMHRTLTQGWNDEIRWGHFQAGDKTKASYLLSGRSGQESLPGSNAWVISGSRSTSGKPILANDPHLEYNLPSTWYLVHLKAPDLDVTGGSLPGVPAVIIGHNQKISWGVTNLGFDVQDLYREQFDQQTGRYLVGGAIRQARPDREAIAVKGGAAVEGVNWFTHRGPLFLSDQNQNYALRWMSLEHDSSRFIFLKLNRASNWDEFNAALEEFPGPAQNFVYADVEGNIGYHVAGVLPNRKGCTGVAPTDESAPCEWDGAIPYQELPSVFNPPTGMIVTANQNPFPKDYPHPVNGIFGSPYRANTIRMRLLAKNKWRPEEMLRIQTDVYSPFGKFLGDQLVKAWDAKPGTSTQIADAVRLLRKWNGQMDLYEPAAMVIAVTIPRIQLAIAKSVLPSATDDDARAVSYPTIEKLLRERPAGWFANFDQSLLGALGEGLEEGSKYQGSKVDGWDYGQWSEITIPNPIAGQIPVVGRFFNIGPVPMNGSPASVKQLTRRLGPSLRMVVDMGNLEGSQANITIGQSAHRLSGHYKDQWDAYYSGTSFPMQFGKVEAESTLQITPK